jgi:hypothetical protein
MGCPFPGVRTVVFATGERWDYCDAHAKDITAARPRNRVWAAPSFRRQRQPHLLGEERDA